MKRPALALLALALGAGSAPSVEARELWRRGDFALDFTGSVREVVQWTRGTDADDFQQAVADDPVQCVPAANFPECDAFDLTGETNVGLSLTRLRLRFEAEAPAGFSAVVAYDNELLAGTLGTLERGVGRDFARDTLLGAEDVIAEGDHVAWQHLLYRGYLLWEHEHAEVTVGRQRVSWGVGRLWSPIDRFNFIPPLSVESDQTPGVDAVDARWLIDGFNFVEFVYAFGDEHDDDRWAFRAHGVLWGADLSLMGGVFEDAPTVGFDFERDVFDAAVHFEAVYTDPERSVWPVGLPGPVELPDFWQVVGSVDINFDVGTGLYALLEHLYNGNALGFGEGKAGPLLNFFESTSPGPADRVVVSPASTDIFGTSQVVSFTKHQTGLQLSYDLLPEVRGNFLAIYDWNGVSAVFFPSLVYSPIGSLELTLGAQVGVGKHLSQYGDVEPLVFLLAEWFF